MILSLFLYASPRPHDSSSLECVLTCGPPPAPFSHDLFFSVPLLALLLTVNQRTPPGRGSYYQCVTFLLSISALFDLLQNPNPHCFSTVHRSNALSLASRPTPSPCSSRLCFFITSFSLFFPSPGSFLRISCSSNRRALRDAPLIQPNLDSPVPLPPPGKAINIGTDLISRVFS